MFIYCTTLTSNILKLFNSKKPLFFPSIIQADAMDCGPTCLRIIAKYHGKIFSLATLREKSYTTREGSSLSQLGAAAESIGFRSLGAKISLKQLEESAPLPCIIHWNQNHYLVVYKIKNKRVYISDPALGLVNYSYSEFIEHWISAGADSKVKEGIVLLIEPTPEFYEQEGDKGTHKKGLRFLIPHLYPHKKILIQILIGLLTGSLLSLIFPFLTQSVVDIGIRNRDIHFVYLILFAQIAIFLGRSSIELIRGWLLMHMSSRINISLVSDFFAKLMRLPISYYDTKMNGDILQRIGDHRRIEHLLTGSSLSVLFSLLNLFIFGFILLFYDLSVFLVFVAGSACYIGWVSFFLKRRAILDHRQFELQSKNQEKILELINGMQEIKLHNAERQKRWGWEYLQARLFKSGIKILTLNQTQSFGANVINEVKNILISFLTASLVIKGSITLGMMMSISYIIGQLNGPIAELVHFMHGLQDARLSLERLEEIHGRADEEPKEATKIDDLPEEADLHLEKVSFQYSGPESNWVIRNLNLDIPANKITAIVGGSGSGKTTLMKLLLKFYTPNRGDILLNTYNLENIAQAAWRNRCGAVMQDGFIFSDTIANNIAVGIEHIDQKRLIEAVDIANIKEFIEGLPLAYNTKIGSNGLGVSGGQKQRILIARAVYKNPQFLFFDEATSALDSKNERIIMENFDRWFKNRTVVIIAHRLSTVRNADQIVVLDQGRIIERGKHEELLELKGSYYNLVKNQLELDKLDS
ncbi:MAG: peptidase domain-containing ABC transporter [Bacteroidia bacterium]